MRLSIVDLGTVAPGTTQADALADALETARQAEIHGYHRIWFAEHHLSRSGASHHPELLIAAAATVTERIRVGSGAVLMNHYSPFKVAEMYQQLEAMAPGRIDLGMGRATAGPVIDVAMQTNRQHPSQADHGQQILETMAWLYEKFPEDHPFHGKPLMPGLGSVPQTWVLGSSPASAQLAGALGLGYCFAGFIDPSSAVTALEIYRSSFQPGRFALPEPRSILAVNVAVGEDDQDGEHLALSPKGFYARLARAGKEAGTVLVPTPPRIEHELTEAQREEPTRIVDGRWPRFVAGGPDTVRATLEQMATESGAGEIMVQDLIPDPGDRRRSHALLAETWGLLGEDTTP